MGLKDELLNRLLSQSPHLLQHLWQGAEASATARHDQRCVEPRPLLGWGARNGSGNGYIQRLQRMAGERGQRLAGRRTSLLSRL